MTSPATAISHRVVIAYDGSPSARAAVRAAAALVPGGEIEVLTIHEAPVSLERIRFATGQPVATEAMRRGVAELEREVLQEAAAVAQEGAELAAEEGLRAKGQTASVRGSAWATILSEAKRQHAELLVCGSRGRGGVARALLGSTSSALQHHADLPILVVPERLPDLSGPVLLAYDGSESSRAAVLAGAALFAGRSAIVVHVWESLLRRTVSGQVVSSAATTEIRELTKGYDETLADSAREQAAEGASLARQHGLDARAEAVESSAGAWRTLSETAWSTNAAVIVAGSRGHSGVTSAALGPVSSGLVHNASLPVCIVTAASPTTN